MLRIDSAILDTNKVICKNISAFDVSERGLLSQNILAQLRNLVEYVAVKIYSNGQDLDPNDYNVNVRALAYLQSRGDLRFLRNFHELLQKSVSHYTIDENGSERLMLKYYEYLLKIKVYLEDYFELQVLDNIEEFPLNTDPELSEYYEKIAEKIITPSPTCTKIPYTDRYYIQKIKPFFVNKKIFYEITFAAANSRMGKFDRLIAFTQQEIMGNYAVKLSIHNDAISILGKDMNIQVIDGWSVSIRPCELNHFADIFGDHNKITVKSYEYQELMEYLTEMKMPLSELVLCSDNDYNYAKFNILRDSKTSNIFDVLDKCRKIIMEKKDGYNVLLYLLYHLNNDVIKRQKSNSPCHLLSNLYLQYGCIPFDQMPFCSSLIYHNPKIFDLLDCLSTTEREHELFARFIKTNTETKGILFTPRKDIVLFEDIDSLIRIHNSKLYLPKHENRKLMIFHNCIYIKGYAEDSSFIIRKLQELSSTGVSQYTNSVDFWLSNSSYLIDSEEKKQALRMMFSTSHVALIYGSAGTGKSTQINHISNFLSGQNKIFLANTHPAINNLKRKVSAPNSQFSTIASFISEKNCCTDCDVLIIDECSTVSNSDMRSILEKATFKLLVLVGDVYQIESIYFGNWFDLARAFVPDNSIFELKNPYRTQSENLLTIWERVRNLDVAILEPLVKNKYSVRLDESIFLPAEDDEIVLCLNYDGLYGINNINRILQNSNPNPAVHWEIAIYKIGDPILFNESERFYPLIHNNSKGRIVDIMVDEKRIWFSIELDRTINEAQTWRYDLELLEPAASGNSIIRFSVDKHKNTDEDESPFNAVVPFQIAYAVSIHKAQGLEYRSVKIVITNESEERITHNIFYTAITRAKEKLKIYWSPETEKSVLEKLTLRDSKRDSYLLAQLYAL